MIFKIISLILAVLAGTNGGYVAPLTYSAVPVVKYVNTDVDGVGSTQQNIHTSRGGTALSYSKAVNTVNPTVQKVGSGINNNVYIPSLGKTVTYFVPPLTKSVVTSTYAKPVSYNVRPTVTKTIVAPTTTYTHAVPAVTKTIYSPSTGVVYSQPAVSKTVAATTLYNRRPDSAIYTHHTPGASGDGTSQTVRYSPAELVSHMSFDGFGTHWGF